MHWSYDLIALTHRNGNQISRHVILSSRGTVSITLAFQSVRSINPPCLDTYQLLTIKLSWELYCIEDCVWEGDIAPFITQGTISPLDYTIYSKQTLQWRHNDHDGVPKLRATGLCVGNSPGPVNSPHKGPVTRKMFPFDCVIMWTQTRTKSTPEIQQTSAY